MKRVLALIFMMVLAVSLSYCADSSQETEAVPNQNVNEMFIESRNDEYKWALLGTQEQMDKF